MASVGSGALGMNSDFVDEEAEFARMTLLSEAIGGCRRRWLQAGCQCAMARYRNAAQPGQPAQI
jgi:hypothetical protein